MKKHQDTFVSLMQEYGLTYRQALVLLWVRSGSKKESERAYCGAISTKRRAMIALREKGLI